MRGEECPWFAFPYFELDGNWISLKIDQPFISPGYVSQSALSGTVSLSKTHWTGPACSTRICYMLKYF